MRHFLDNTIAPSEITTPTAWQLWQRRRWLIHIAGGALGIAAASSADTLRAETRPAGRAPLIGTPSRVAGAQTVEKTTSYQDATQYNNFYELGTDKSDPARYASALSVQPWQIEIEGLVKKAGTFHLEDLLKFSAMEERIYRLRCVEGWSMVIPWVGYSLSELIRRCQPLGSAKFVEFISQADPKTMQGVRSRVLDWPYVEGLRMDEAMHPLTLLSFGMYGEVLPAQNGAPVRLVVPWKYGFKSAKRIVKIRFVEKEPVSSWTRSAPQEYGFYSNVNPQVDHPRWSQASERRIGEDGLFSRKRKTLMFNGYAEQVGQLYAGMDLRKFF